MQRLSERLPQELLAAQLGVAMRPLHAPSPAQTARLAEPDRTSGLLTPRGHDRLATPRLALHVQPDVFSRPRT